MQNYQNEIHGRTGGYWRRGRTLYSTSIVLCESVAFVGNFSKSDFLGVQKLTRADASLVNCVILRLLDGHGIVLT
jgi:hypothetical protein